MNFIISMPKGLRPFYQQELIAYRQAMVKGDLTYAWARLERAHIIGQAYPGEHSYVHWLMLDFGIKIKNPKEILGQIPRLLVGGVKSFVGKIPTGNTGGSNVHPLKPMKIPADLQEILKKYGGQK